VTTWEALKAQARASCVTVKDRLWCEVALALGAAVRWIASVDGAPDDAAKRAWVRVQTRKAREAIEAAARAERRAQKAAKDAAREERKRMRRAECAAVPPHSSTLWGRRNDMERARIRLLDARMRNPPWENGIRFAREDVRDAELRYAIACAEAGAVPGGRLH
jgi:hypothetical protein